MLDTRDIAQLEKILNEKIKKKVIEWGIILRDEIKLRIDDGGFMPYDTERLRDSVTVSSPPIGNTAQNFSGNVEREPDGSYSIKIDTSADEGIRTRVGEQVIKTGEYEPDHGGFVPYVMYVEYGTTRMRAYAPFRQGSQKVNLQIIQPQLQELIKEASKEMAKLTADKIASALEAAFK